MKGIPSLTVTTELYLSLCRGAIMTKLIIRMAYLRHYLLIEARLVLLFGFANAQHWRETFA